MKNISTTDGHGWTRMGKCFLNTTPNREAMRLTAVAVVLSSLRYLSVFIRVHPWLKQFPLYGSD